MANISDAYGTITIRVRTDDTEKFVRTWNILSDRLSSGEYSTQFDGIGIYSPDIERNEDDDGTVEISMSDTFSGTGRWAYQANIEYFGSWLDYEVNEEEKAFLEQLDFSVEYSFTDYEPGCCVFYEMEAHNTHIAGMSLRDISNVIDSSYDLEISASELISRGFDEAECIADLGIGREALMEWFIADESDQHTCELIREVFESDEGYEKFCREHRNEMFYYYHEYEIDWLDYLF